MKFSSQHKERNGWLYDNKRRKSYDLIHLSITHKKQYPD